MYSESKRHHYVPKFYLSQWAKPDGFLEIVTKRSSRIIRDHKAPKTTGYEWYLYSYSKDLPMSGKDQIEIQFLKKIDDAGKRISDKILNGTTLTDNEKEIWAHFLATLRVRTPENITRLKSFFEARYFENSQFALDQDNPSRRAFAQSLGIASIPRVSGQNEVLERILSFDWDIVKIQDTRRDLISSDRPLVINTSLDSTDCILLLPMSNTHFFIAHNQKSQTANSLRKKKGKELTRYINILVCEQARNRAYCRKNTGPPDTFFQKHLSEFSETG